MIWTSFILLCHLLSPTEISLEEAKSISASFRLSAAKAGTVSIVGSAPYTGNPTVSETEYPGCYDLDYGDGHTIVRKSDGKIVKFWCRDNSEIDLVWNDIAKLSPSQILSLSQNYRINAGIPGMVGVDSVREYKADDVNTGATLYFDVRVSPRVGGVGYSDTHASYLEISHTTGRLLDFEYRDVPTAPASVVPAVTEAAARATAVSFIFATRGIGSFADITPSELCIWKPVSEIPPGSDNFLNATHSAMVTANQGLLIYNFYVEGRDTFISKGVYSPRFQAFVDAQTGDLLLLYEYKPMGGGGTGGKSKPSSALGPGPLEIVDLSTKRSWKAPNADLSPSVGTLPQKPMRVLLKRGKFHMIAHLDLSSGLVKANGATARLDKASLTQLQNKWSKESTRKKSSK